MNGLRLTRPSVWRAIGFTIAIAVVFAVAAGMVLYANAIVTHRDARPTPVGDYVHLLVLDVVFWGPMALRAIWQISLPVILGLGVFAASLYRAPKN
ncbi:hypothetical protein BH11ACT7_BH11ACT7_04520 [soil metagenome]